jgi:hypothetical protein
MLNMDANNSATHGPDRFPLSPPDRLHGAQLRLNDFLVTDNRSDQARAPLDGAPWKKLPKRQIIEQLEAVLRRFTWLSDHDAELANAHVFGITKEDLAARGLIKGEPAAAANLRDRFMRSRFVTPADSAVRGWSR